MSASRDAISIKRLFIANRGEICRRIALTARRLGIETVAITDQETPPAFLADIVTTFIKVTDESPALYLDMHTMVTLAKSARCDAVHPGFGFLSENSEFAALCQASGLTWVGPNAEAIAAMASKSAARDKAIAAGVPCIEGMPGFDPTSNDAQAQNKLEKFAAQTGFPLLIKAAYGGGGKGMRLVYKPEELLENALRAASEAKNSFGNPLIIVERYLESPRHIEVQIMADKHGNVAAVGDRDCSLQRRHQKIIEEAPAPGIRPEIRQQIHEAAIRLAQAVKYDNAGTVEFLLDDKTEETERGEVTGNQKFYFLEMNTRLQVEHPVTEEVHGLDLVEWQFRVASGMKLSTAVLNSQPRGHSIEARLYAENVDQNYFPAPGPVRAFVPAAGPGVRWEVGIDTVDVISTKFDPMVAKLVVTGADRQSALDRMHQTLSRTFFAAEHTNQELLIWLVSASKFRNKPVSTHFLGDKISEFKAFRDQLRQQHRDTFAQIESNFESVANGINHSNQGSNAVQTATAMAFGMRSKPSAQAKIRVPTISVHDAKGIFAKIGVGVLTLNSGETVPFHWASCNIASNGSRKESWYCLNGMHVMRAIERRQAAASDGSLVTHEIVAPVPGKVIAVKAKPNQDVELGTAVVILESMKMEFEVKAGRSGTVADIKVKVGDQVTAGQVLAHWAD